MKSRPSPLLPHLRATAFAALAWFTPFVASADSIVFSNPDFLSDTLLADPGSITSSGTNWYVLSSKNGSTSSISGGTLNLTYANDSSAAAVEGVARFTVSPITLSSVGDSITARASVYTNKVSYLSVGLYDSGLISPLTTLANTGLDGTILTTTTGGTLGWKGYRGRLQIGQTSGNIAARLPQTILPMPRASHDVVATATGEYASPGPVSIGSIPASPTPVPAALDGYAQYRVIYKITRSAANAYTISYTLTDASDTVLYSVSGVTTNTGTKPSELTSSFDAFAIGNRNDTATGNSPSTLSISSVTITAKNSAIAAIAQQPLAQTWVAGTPGSISVLATGTAPLSYQWYKDNSPVGGATAATYTVNSPTGDNTGSYHVVVTNAFGSETSAAVNVSLAAASAPSFTLHPVSDLIVNEGEPLTLNALASGAPTSSYQWIKGTSDDISGATYPTFTIANAGPSDGGTYKVRATNASGTQTSNVATVTINSQAPAITTEPVAAVVNVGAPITLTAGVSGYPAPSYQWYKGTAPSGTLISGATGASYTVASATTPDNGSYYVIATNRLGTATSAGASVTVNVVAPAITTPPASTTVALGNPATFSVSATGSAPLFYQWYKGSTLIDGATSASYTINPTVGTSAGDYHVVVSNEGGPSTAATSASATLSLIVTEQTPVFTTNFAGDTINSPSPVITSTSTSWFVLAGKNARTCTIGDDPATTDVIETRPYTLKLEGGSSSAYFETAARFANTPVSLAQVGSQLRVTLNFTTQNILTLGFGLYNSGGSHPKQLDFDPRVGLPSEEAALIPANQIFQLGTGGTTAVGAGTQNWIGYRSTLGNLAGTGNVGQAIATRPAQINTTTNRGQELCVTGSGTVSYGEPGGVTVATASKTPSSDAVGNLVNNNPYTLVYTISRSAADQFTLSYQIYEGTGTSGTLFRSATATTAAALAVPPALGNRPSEVTQSFDAFAIGMRNAGNTTPTTIPEFVFSNFSVVHSVPVEAVYPSITDQPENATVAVGAPFTLTAAASGSPTPTYQWWKNTGSGFSIIPGATSASYSVGSASASDAATYKFVATNALGAVESDVVTVTVGSAASAYDTWTSAKGLTVANNGPTQDPDSDGVNNLLEFALGGDPLASSTSILPVAAKSGSNLTLTYHVEVAATVDYTIGTESTTDLTGTWAPVVHGVGGATIVETPVDADTDQVVVTVPATGARTFLRVEVAPKP